MKQIEIQIRGEIQIEIVTNTKCLTAVCADARSFFDPQTLHRQLLHVFFCCSIFLFLFSTRNLDKSSTLHSSQIMTQTQPQILTQIQTQVVTQMQSQICDKDTN